MDGASRRTRTLPRSRRRSLGTVAGVSGLNDLARGATPQKKWLNSLNLPPGCATAIVGFLDQLLGSAAQIGFFALIAPLLMEVIFLELLYNTTYLLGQINSLKSFADWATGPLTNCLAATFGASGRAGGGGQRIRDERAAGERADPRRWQPDRRRPEDRVRRLRQLPSVRRRELVAADQVRSVDRRPRQPGHSRARTAASSTPRWPRRRRAAPRCRPSELRVDVEVRQALVRYQAAVIGPPSTRAACSTAPTRCSRRCSTTTSTAARRCSRCSRRERTSNEVFLGYYPALADQARALVAVEQAAGIWDVDF